MIAPAMGLGPTIKRAAKLFEPKAGDTHRVALRVPPAALAGIRNTQPDAPRPDLGGGLNARAAPSGVNAVSVGVGAYETAKSENAELSCSACGHRLCSCPDWAWR